MRVVLVAASPLAGSLAGPEAYAAAGAAVAPLPGAVQASTAPVLAEAGWPTSPEAETHSTSGSGGPQDGDPDQASAVAPE